MGMFVFFVLHVLRFAQAWKNGEDVFLAGVVGFIAYSFGYCVPVIARPTLAMKVVATAVQLLILGNAFAKGFHVYKQEPYITFLVYGWAAVIMAYSSFLLPQRRAGETVSK